MKLDISKISFYQLPEAVQASYEGDKDLLNKYHVAKWDTVKGAVTSTMVMIHACSKVKDLSYYKVTHQKKCIGYIVTFDNFLYSFGLSIKSRTEEIKEAFWSAIKKLLGNQFGCSLYNNNVRAIKFLEKQGMEIGSVDEENHMTILYNTNKNYEYAASNDKVETE